MMHTTSPLRTSIETPFKTSTEPKDLWTSLMLTIGLSPGVAMAVDLRC